MDEDENYFLISNWFLQPNVLSESPCTGLIALCPNETWYWTAEGAVSAFLFKCKLIHTDPWNIFMISQIFDSFSILITGIILPFSDISSSVSDLFWIVHVEWMAYECCRAPSAKYCCIYGTSLNKDALQTWKTAFIVIVGDHIEVIPGIVYILFFLTSLQWWQF